MAYLTPKNSPFRNSAEEFVGAFIRDNLPSDWVVYVNPTIRCRELDLLLLVPDVGVFVIEVKGFEAHYGIAVKDNQHIHYGHEPNQKVWPSPRRQADRYRYALISRAREEFDREPRVLVVIAYPNLTKDDYISCQLDIISDPAMTFTREDFQSAEIFQSRLCDYAKLIPRPAPLPANLMLQLRHWYETVDSIDGHQRSLIEHPSSKIAGDRGEALLYSMLIVKTAIGPSDIALILRIWRQGARITVITHELSGIERLQKEIKTSVDRDPLLSKNSAFTVVERSEGKGFHLFNLSVLSTLTPPCENIRIDNGAAPDTLQHLIALQEISRESGFNLEQYRLEHAPVEAQIVVRAGAGTGKTYAMVTRIMYLRWRHQYTPEQFSKRLALVTFTRAASRSMKRRLRQALLSQYAVTRDADLIRTAERIEGMSIGTIHSFASRILSANVSLTGLGRDIRISSGIQARRDVLQRNMNDLIQSLDSAARNDLETECKGAAEPLTKYLLCKRAESLMDEMEKKGIDLAEDWDFFDFGASHKYPRLFTLFLEAGRRSVIETRQILDVQGAIRLSDVMLRLRNALRTRERCVQPAADDVDYLFVDEFQDTDDTQIRLLLELQETSSFRFFVVGDIKQCIYRFRGAEQQAFNTLKLSTLKIPNWAEFRLTQNYRSSEKLLSRFHSIFLDWGSKKLLDYTAKDGLRSVRSGDANKPITVYKYNNDKQRFDNLVKIVQELCAKHEGRIALLVRKNEQVNDLRIECEKRGLFVKTDGSGRLFRIPSTIDLCKLVGALLYSDDPRRLYSLFETGFVNSPLPKRTLESLRKRGTSERCQAFPAVSGITDWEKYVASCRLEPALKVVRDLIRDTSPWKKYARLHSDDPEAARFYRLNLEKLIEELSSRRDTDYLTLSRIYEYLKIAISTDQLADDRVLSGDHAVESGVVALTIHKAKGLEFETVILPFCDRDLPGLKFQMGDAIVLTGQTIPGAKSTVGCAIRRHNWGDFIKNDHILVMEKVEKLEREREEVRLLYVALTRSIDRLLLVTTSTVPIKQTWQWYLSEVMK